MLIQYKSQLFCSPAYLYQRQDVLRHVLLNGMKYSDRAFFAWDMQWWIGRVLMIDLHCMRLSRFDRCILWHGWSWIYFVSILHKACQVLSFPEEWWCKNWNQIAPHQHLNPFFAWIRTKRYREERVLSGSIQIDFQRQYQTFTGKLPGSRCMVSLLAIILCVPSLSMTRLSLIHSFDPSSDSR